MPEDDDRIINTCPECSQRLDVTEQEPYSKIGCPSCEATIRVRTDFDHFSLKDQIGTGGMSRVFRGVDTTLGRDVALKILNKECSSDAERIEQFEREAQITASISHPNVVKVYSVGRDQAYFYIAMELVSHGSLDELIHKKKRIPEPLVLNMAIDLVKGLDAAHKSGLIHRDIKPGNILFAEDGTPKIVDFGLALFFQKDEDTSSEIWATPQYVPPEKLFGEPEDFRSDMYSLGASLFQALAGRPPFEADTASLEELRRLKDQDVSLASFVRHVSPATEAVIDRMVARQPADRFESYDEALAALESAKQGAKRGLKGARRMVAQKPKAALWLGLGAAALAGIVAYVALPPGGEDAVDPVVTPIAEGGGETEVVTGGTIAEQFLAARKLMLSGKTEEAKKQFSQVAADESVRQPTLNWTHLNVGICNLLSGDSEGMRGAFEAILDNGVYSTEEEDEELVTFFLDVAGVMSSGMEVYAEEQHSFDPDSVGAIAYLLFAMKNWDGGETDQTRKFIGAFQDATPSRDYQWIESYEGLVEPILADIEVVGGFPELADGAKLREAKDAVAKGKEVVAAMKTRGGFYRDLVSRIEAYEEAVERLSGDEARVAAAAEDRVKTKEGREFSETIAEVRRKYLDDLKFSAGVTDLGRKKFKSDEAKAVLKDEIFLWKTSEAFVEQLIEDLNTVGYRGTVERLGASPLKVTEVKEATREHLSVQAGMFVRKVPMEQIPSTMLVAMAEKIAGQIPDSDAYYDRMEKIVVFAYNMDLRVTVDRVGGALLEENRSFRRRWTQLLERRT